MKLIVLAALALLAPAVAHAQADAPLMKVLIKPGRMDEKVGKGIVDVTITQGGADAAAGAPLMSMVVVSGNTESVARKLENLNARDSQGPLTLVAKDDPEALSFSRHWSATRPVVGELTVSYRAPVDNTPPTRGSGPPLMLRIDGDGVSAGGSLFLMAPETRKPYRLALAWDLSAMGPGATATSSFGDGAVELPAGSPGRFNRAVFMAGGHMHREPLQPVGGFSSAWLGQPPFEPKPLMDWTHQLHTWMSGFFQDKVVPPYRVFIRFNPINAGGGTALTNSFFTTYNAATKPDSIKGTLAHEMTHTWTAQGPGQWYSEGNAVHYQALLPWRAGLFTTADFIADINETASRYYSNGLINEPDDQIGPRFWEDTRIRTLPYDRGGMYFAVLDAKIRKASGGKRSVDDLIRAMIVRARSGQPVTEAVWLDLVATDLGAEGLAIHKSMLAGGVMLPDADAFGPCFTRTTKTIRRFELGFDPKSLVGDVKTIKGLMPNSEAAKAGVRDGDVVTYSQALDSAQGDTARMLTLHVTRAGKTSDITYLPRGENVDVYQWARVPGVADSACKY
jgi:predicted metalloprotease with PDZ domain